MTHRIPLKSFLVQLPQVILSNLILELVHELRTEWYNGKRVVIVRENLCMSLGEVIFIADHGYCEKLVKHEYGHSLQSEDWGWLYLPLILSLSTACWVYSKVSKRRVIFILRWYYSLPWERDADRRGGVKRRLPF